MDKKSTLKSLLSMTAAASLFLGAGCGDSQKQETTQKEPVKVTVPVLTAEQIQKARIDKIYETMRDMSCNMTYYPYLDRGTVRIGFGTPIEDPAILANITFFNSETGHRANTAEKLKIIENVKQNGGSIYKTNTLSIRVITKDYLTKAEEKAMQLIPNYLNMPIEAQTVALQTELLTRGKLGTYKQFCRLMNDGQYSAAAEECGIKGLKHARFNQDRRDMLRALGNQGDQAYASKPAAGRQLSRIDRGRD